MVLIYNCSEYTYLETRSLRSFTSQGYCLYYSKNNLNNFLFKM